MRPHMTLPTAVGFAVVTPLGLLGDDAATIVHKVFGEFPKRVIRTMSVETATPVVPKYDLIRFVGVGQGPPSGLVRGLLNGMSGVLKDSETWNTSFQSVESAGHSAADNKNWSGERADGATFTTIGFRGDRGFERLRRGRSAVYASVCMRLQ